MENNMKSAVCVLMILALSMCAFAANGSMSLMSPAKLNGKQLNQGAYKVSWTAEGDNVQVAISGNGVEMSVPASVVRSTAKLQHDSVLKSQDGVIQEINIASKNIVVKFATEAPKNN
jgi:hypothetical protein